MFKNVASLLLALSMMACMMPMEAMAETDSVSNSRGVATLNSAEQKINERGATSEEKSLAEGALQLPQQDVEPAIKESGVDNLLQDAADDAVVVEDIASVLSSDEDDVRVYRNLL